MNRTALLLSAALCLAVSCSPEIYTHYLDVRQPSDAGLDLSRKSMSLVYMDGDIPADSAFNRSVASAMARTLEEDYFGGEEVVGLYRIPKADSLSLDMMHSLVMDTGDDVIFLVTSSLGEAVMESNQELRNARSVDSAYVCPAQVPLKTYLYLYDSLGEDVVHRFTGSTVLRPAVYNNGITPVENLKDKAREVVAGGEAERVGNKMASRFVSNWQTESFSFYYFDNFNEAAWIDALQKALDGKFAAAIDAWAPFVSSGNYREQSCACYNIALAFYLLDDVDLASRWLDQADALDDALVLSAGLRKRIDARKAVSKR